MKKIALGLVLALSFASFTFAVDNDNSDRRKKCCKKSEKCCSKEEAKACTPEMKEQAAKEGKKCCSKEEASAATEGKKCCAGMKEAKSE